MNLKINTVPSGNNYNTVYGLKNKNINFRSTGNKTLRRMSYALIASAMFTAASCIKNNKNNDVKIKSTIEETDSSYSSTGEYHYKDKVVTYYHYFPKENNMSHADKYDWIETIFPDGRIEKDSIGHKIFIKPDGQRTDIKTEFDKNGNKIITTKFPDGTKFVKTIYKTQKDDDYIRTEKKYRKDGTIKESQFFREYIPDDTTINKQVVIEKKYQKYNEKGILVYWEASYKGLDRNNSNNKYDKRGRLIYDDFTNEKYYYKGRNKTPYRSESQCEDCLRVTLYKKDGTVKEVFFKASDGTITHK